RADELRRRIEAACTGLIRYRAREHSDPLAEAALTGTTVSEDDDELPEDVRQQVVREFKERSYAGWVDEPIPMLDGKTPRVAARTKRGRARVDLLLREMENLEGRLPVAERFDVSRLRAELGLRR